MKLHQTVLALPVAAIMALAGSSATMSAPPSASFSFGITSGPGYDDLGYDDPDYDDCLSEGQIVRELRHSGYRTISLVDEEDDTLVFLARARSRTYQLEVDACSGDLLSRTRVRSRY